MPTVYSATNQWPLLQSKTEQKFKSGLFNVSAEFIRPVGNTDLPTSIETSIGPVEVWPDPTVSSGTDGFERINATGYGVWDSAPQIQYGVGPGILNFFADIRTARYYGDPETCERNFVSKQYSLPASTEYCIVTQIYEGDAPIVYPSLPRELKVWDEQGNSIATSTFDFSKPFPPLNPNDYNFPDHDQSVSIYKSVTTEPSMEHVGNLKIVTMTFKLLSPAFYFSFIEPDPPECTGWV